MSFSIPATPGSAAVPRLLAPALMLLLAAAWLGGGPTVDRTAIDEGLELLAIPVLLVAVLAWTRRDAAAPLERAALVVLVAIAMLPLLQLLPLPGGAWSMPAARAEIAADLQAAGVTGANARWSLMPQASERALWALLPASACFLGAMALPRRFVPRFAQLLLALVLANLLFGFFQAGLPADSPLRLYARAGTGFGGVLVNTNHQGSALAIGMLLALGLCAETRRRQRRGEALPWRVPAYIACAAICFVAIPLTGSRAAMLLAIAALAAAGPALGFISPRRRRRNTGGLAVAALALLLAAWSALGWMQDGTAGELRPALRAETLQLGLRHAPLGSGIGSFVDVFAQDASPVFQQADRVNHAHDEYLQWWLEGGIAALAVMLAALAVLAWTGWTLLRDVRRRPLPVACWLAVAVLLLHSVVDYPLRTLSLMTAGALLAGIAVAAAAREPRQAMNAAAHERQTA